ncbi:MAG: hypothetical protein KKB50_18635 [Planctomycetes bacterium]|nr:hypothetical protein [Planctomycetota bacterium]
MGRASGSDMVVRCVCGKRYRVRNAQPGVRTTCPECGSLLEITAADFETTFAADGSIQFHEEAAGEPKEATLLEGSTLRPATKGARPGLTAGVLYEHEEAALADAIDGRRFKVGVLATPGAGDTSADEPVRTRTFLNDLLACFYFAGNPGNAANIALTAAAYSLIFMIGHFMVGPFILIVVFPYALTVLYVVQFYWTVLTVTAAGEDELPWFDADWSWWHSGLKPLLWVGWISFICSLPGLWVHWYMPDTDPGKTALFWGVLVTGWFFWPVAVMSVALGNSILFIRPDWLIRCVVGVGPVYIVAWIAVLITLGAWVLFLMMPEPAFVSVVPVAGELLYVVVVTFVNLYFGYVLFRILGLIFRHFRTRFPWKY